MLVMWNFKGGFTLIELLIVISIVGILSGTVVLNLSGTRGTAQDSVQEFSLVNKVAVLERQKIKSKSREGREKIGEIQESLKKVVKLNEVISSSSSTPQQKQEAIQEKQRQIEEVEEKEAELESIDIKEEKVVRENRVPSIVPASPGSIGETKPLPIVPASPGSIGETKPLPTGLDFKLDFKLAQEPNLFKLKDSVSFGASTAISSDLSTIFVGASGDDTGGEDKGAVHILRKNPEGEYIKSIKIDSKTSGLNLKDSDHFGHALTITPNGNTLVVAAKEDGSSIENNRGAVYIFKKRLNNEYGFSAKIDAKTENLNLPESINFGISIAITPDAKTLVIGTSDEAGIILGKVYIFEKNQVGKYVRSKQIVEVPASDNKLLYAEGFGRSVTISRDAKIIVVGAPSEQINGRRRGAVYIFKKDSSNEYIYSEKISTLNEGFYIHNNNRFGISVAITPDGSKLAVGANGYGNIFSQIREESVLIFNLNKDKDENYSPEIVKLSYIKEGLGFTDFDFGHSVAISIKANILLVGAPVYFGDRVISGKVFLFEKKEEAYVLSKVLPVEPEEFYAKEEDYLGYSVAITPDSSTLVVGAIRDDTRIKDGGAVYIFTKNAENKYAFSEKLSNNRDDINILSESKFGSSVGVSKDGNTIVVGAYRELNEKRRRGALYIFQKKNGKYVNKQKIENGRDKFVLKSGDEFGKSVAISQDAKTLFVGNPRFDLDDKGTKDNIGAVYVFKKDSNNKYLLSETISDSAANGINLNAADEFGRSIAISKDTNVLLVGSIGTDDDENGKISTGTVYVFKKQNKDDPYKNPTKLPTSGLNLIDYSYFGKSVSITEDASRIVVGGWSEDESGSVGGSAYVFAKKPNGEYFNTSILSAETLGNNWSEEYFFGTDVAISSNPETLVLGSTLDDTSEKNAGAVYIFKKK